jgi:hypothetical protein
MRAKSEHGFSIGSGTGVLLLCFSGGGIVVDPDTVREGDMGAQARRPVIPRRP